MHVILIAPHFPSNQRQFARALREAGAWVTGIGEAPLHMLDSELRSWLGGYEQVSNVCDEDQMVAAVRRIQRRGWVDRLEATVEAHILSAARVRELTGIPGTSVRTSILCRDKPIMKDFLRENGIATAASTAVDSGEEALSFAHRGGYPRIVKPRAGAGAQGTSRVDNDGQLQAATKEFGLGRGGSAAIEEFIEGHEGFYDTLTIGGQVHIEFITHYYPNVLEAMRERDVAPYFITTNRVDSPGYNELKNMGRRVISALGIGTSATHMEWFYGPKGLKFSEIGARPPGVGTWDLYCAANGFDLYKQWAMAVAQGRLTERPSRQFAASMVALRPDRDGTIVGYTGVEEVRRELGPAIIDLHLPHPGTRTQPVDAGYMANAWIRLRHPDYDTLRRMSEWTGRTLRVHAR